MEDSEQFVTFYDAWSYNVPDDYRIHHLATFGFYGGAGLEYRNVKIAVSYDFNAIKNNGTYFSKRGFEYSICYYFLRLK